VRLLALEPSFLRHAIEIADEDRGRPGPDGTTQWGGFPISVFHHVRKRRNADGVTFLCPLCFQRNAGPVGTHGIRVYFRGSSVPEGIGTNKDGQTVRWDASNDRLESLTLAPSIQLQGGCNWHGHVQNGQIVGGLD
jgi:hypothetical protein